MLNVKQGSCEYQDFQSFGLTRQGNRTQVYQIRGGRSNNKIRSRMKPQAIQSEILNIILPACLHKGVGRKISRGEERGKNKTEKSTIKSPSTLSLINTVYENPEGPRLPTLRMPTSMCSRYSHRPYLFSFCK